MLVVASRKKYGEAVIAAALELIEERRLSKRLSQRKAAEWAGISEATWRQLVARGVMQRGEWVARHPRRDQLLDMAHAVGALADVAQIIEATDDELADTRSRVVVPSPAAQEILENRFLNLDEKVELLKLLERLRASDDER